MAGLTHLPGAGRGYGRQRIARFDCALETLADISKETTFLMGRPITAFVGPKLLLHFRPHTGCMRVSKFFWGGSNVLLQSI